MHAAVLLCLLAQASAVIPPHQRFSGDGGIAHQGFKHGTEDDSPQGHVTHKQATKALGVGAQLLQAQAAPSPKLSVAGRCSVLLLLTYPVVHFALFVMQEAFPKFVKPNTITIARSALSSIPLFCILMLFVMFRAKMQGLDNHASYPTIQWMYIIGTTGIVMKIVESLELSVTAKFRVILKNLSVLLIFVGVVGCVVGVTEIREPKHSHHLLDSDTSEICLVFCVMLFLLVQLALLIAEYLQTTGGAKTDKDKQEIQQARFKQTLATLKIVPCVALVLSYFYLTSIVEGEPTAKYADYFMIATVFGVFCQVYDVLMGGKMFMRMGIVIYAVGFAGMLYFAISDAVNYSMVTESISLPLTALVLLALSTLGSMLLTFVEEPFSMYELSEDAKKCAEQMQGALEMSTVLALVMMYLHFRSLLIDAPIPSYVFFSAYASVMCMLFMVLLPMGLKEYPTAMVFSTGIFMVFVYIWLGLMITGAVMLGGGSLDLKSNWFWGSIFSMAYVLIAIFYMVLAAYDKMEAEEAAEQPSVDPVLDSAAPPEEAFAPA